MLEFIRPSSWMYTLYLASEEYNVDYEMIQSLLYSIYKKNGLLSDDSAEIELEIPIAMSISDLHLSTDYTIYDLRDEGLVNIVGDNISLTKLTGNIFKRAEEIQKKDYGIGFFC